MNGRLDASELLKIARETLLQALLPSLPKELRYETFMVALAFGIAASASYPPQRYFGSSPHGHRTAPQAGPQSPQ
nr:hypothetical protein [Azotobacter salinestris]